MVQLRLLMSKAFEKWQAKKLWAYFELFAALLSAERLLRSQGALCGPMVALQVDLLQAVLLFLVRLEIRVELQSDYCVHGRLCVSPRWRRGWIYCSLCYHCL